MIEITNLTKNYGQKSVYKNFNLQIEEGKVTCILGESGSGKTTLLNCIARLTEFKGDIPELSCSYVFQTPRLVPNLSVYKNLSLVCKNAAKIDEMTERLHIADLKERYPVTLSGGQAQRVSLARAFIVPCDILLMDEPFSSLDLKLKTEITALFCGLQKDFARTTLFVTHDVDEALNVSDRIILLKNGEIALDLIPTDREKARNTLISGLTDA